MPGASVKLTDSIVAGFTVAIDGREKQPYSFQNLCADARQRCRPLIIPWEWAHLETGDYSIVGYEAEIAIERKSLADLFMTLGSHRARFRREHERLAALDYAAVVIEGTMDDAVRFPPPHSRLVPKVVFRTALAWSIKFHVPWIWTGSRRLGEITTFRLLEKWWKKRIQNEEDKQRLSST